jgi:hypothetical protein
MHSFTSALDGGERSALSSGRFIPRERPYQVEKHRFSPNHRSQATSGVVITWMGDTASVIDTKTWE